MDTISSVIGPLKKMKIRDYLLQGMNLGNDPDRCNRGGLGGGGPRKGGMSLKAGTNAMASSSTAARRARSTSSRQHVYLHMRQAVTLFDACFRGSIGQCRSCAH